MNIQSLSICVPANRCINDCKFCCSKMHGGEYEDKFSNIYTYATYVEDLRKRLQYARDNGCNTIMLTGNNEPQQNKEFLKIFGLVNKSLPNPFLNIEMQTSGAFIDEKMVKFLKEAVGVTTIAISVACLNLSKKNREMIQTKDESLEIANLSTWVKKYNMTLRICLNMNDDIIFTKGISPVEGIINYCKILGADQITFRALWSSEPNTSQYKWIQEHVTEKTFEIIDELNADIKKNGRYLETLEYGADRYDYEGFSVVIDDDSMSQSQEKKNAVKYLILRPDGKLYSKWDSKASLIF